MNDYRKLGLYGLLAVVVLYLGGDWVVVNLWKGPEQDRLRQIAALESDVKKRKDFLQKAREDARWLAYWESLSLPTDLEVARSLYQAWLVELTRYAGLTGPSFNPGEPVARRGRYYAIAYSVRARGTLEQLCTFLFEFYKAGHLHQIRSVDVSPIMRSDDLDLSLSIEALVLPRADRGDRLSTRTVDIRLASARLDDYRPIAERNLFAVGDPGADPTDHAYLTGISYVDGEPEAWFTLRTDGVILKLREGDRLVQTGRKIRKLCEVEDLDSIRFEGLRSPIGTVTEIQQESVLVLSDGQFKLATFAPGGSDLVWIDYTRMVTPVGRVVEMEDTDLVLRAGDGERWLISTGESLAQAYALPPEF